jgi:hypothetical protein
MNTIYIYVLSFQILLLGSSTFIKSQWNQNSNQNNPISVFSGDQTNSQLCRDDSGGAIICWEDRRIANNGDIYIQRISSEGIIKWTLNGINICSAANLQNRPKIISDNNGGAIICWEDYRAGGGNRDIYAQRINSLGISLWNTNGIDICDTTSVQDLISITNDDSGGLLICWRDMRNLSSSQIYVQKVNSAGVQQWGNNGFKVTVSNSYSQDNPKVISNGSGGCIISWQELRPGTNYDIYAQQINSSGSRLWGNEGIVIANSSISEVNPNMTTDGSNGAIFTWVKLVASSNSDIFAQRVNSAGIVQWVSNGIPICDQPANQQNIEIIPDGLNGAFVCWEDNRNSNTDIYFQRLNSAGMKLWNTEGVRATNILREQTYQKITKDSLNNIVVTFNQSAPNGQDIFAQKLNSSGTVLWDSAGIPVSNPQFNQVFSNLILSNNGSFIVTWNDTRGNNVEYDVYCSKLYSNGSLVSVSSSYNSILLNFELGQNYPNPFNPATKIRFSLPKQSFVRINLYNILGEKIKILVSESLNTGSYEVEINTDYLSSGTYFYEMTSDDYRETKKMMLIK